jgi:hypothetical protein
MARSPGSRNRRHLRCCSKTLPTISERSFDFIPHIMTGLSRAKSPGASPTTTHFGRVPSHRRAAMTQLEYPRGSLIHEPLSRLPRLLNPHGHWSRTPSERTSSVDCPSDRSGEGETPYRSNLRPLSRVSVNHFS